MAARRLFHLQPCGEGHGHGFLGGFLGLGKHRGVPLSPRLSPRWVLVASARGPRRDALGLGKGMRVLIFLLGGSGGEKIALHRCWRFYLFFLQPPKLSWLGRMGCPSCGDAVGQEERGKRSAGNSGPGSSGGVLFYFYFTFILL